MDRMYKVDKNFTWDQYFKQIDIYQGRSHWTTVKRLIYKLKEKYKTRYLITSVGNASE